MKRIIGILVVGIWLGLVPFLIYQQDAPDFQNRICHQQAILYEEQISRSPMTQAEHTALMQWRLQHCPAREGLVTRLSRHTEEIAINSAQKIGHLFP